VSSRTTHHEKVEESEQEIDEGVEIKTEEVADGTTYPMSLSSLSVGNEETARRKNKKSRGE